MVMRNATQAEQMKAEFLGAVAEIRARADEAQMDSLRAAFAAISEGDTAGRDLSCEKAANISQITRDAIIEAARRIGRKYGLSEDAMAEAIDRMTA